MQPSASATGTDNTRAERRELAVHADDVLAATEPGVRSVA
jgi:hypothetical protein